MARQKSTKAEKPAETQVLVDETELEREMEAVLAETEKTAAEAEAAAAPTFDPTAGAIQREDITRVETSAEPMVTLAEAREMIAQAVAEALRDQAQQQPRVIQVAADTERVQFLFMAEVSDDNVYTVGEGGMYGRITGKTGAFSVPKGDLSRAMDGMFRYMLDKRWIIAVSGLTDEEREAYGVNYREGELLDKKAFSRMVELETGILDIYPKLCAGHREMVAKRFHEAYAAKNPHVRRDVVVKLNRMSKELGSPNGDFRTILEAMNASDLAD